MYLRGLSSCVFYVIGYPIRPRVITFRRLHEAQAIEIRGNPPHLQFLFSPRNVYAQVSRLVEHLLGRLWLTRYAAQTL